MNEALLGIAHLRQRHPPLLEEIGKPCETEKLDVSGGATHQPPFIGINPKGKVPTPVRDDGTMLTEFSASATRLARSNPEEALLPNDVDGEARAGACLNFPTESRVLKAIQIDRDGGPDAIAHRACRCAHPRPRRRADLVCPVQK